MPTQRIYFFISSALYLSVCLVIALTSAIAQTPPAIESTAFEYQALAGNASNIDRRVAAALPTAPASVDIVVATPTDVGAINQLQITLGQGALVKSRLNTVTSSLSDGSTYRCISASQAPNGLLRSPRSGEINFTPQSETGGTGLLTPFLTGLQYAVTNASAISTLASTIATLGSVTETVSPAAGGLNDTSLVNLLAGDLARRSYNVIVPSMFPPGLAAQPFNAVVNAKGQLRVPGSILGTMLARLEYARFLMYHTANQRILSPQCQYTVTDKKSNKVVVNAAVIAQMTAAVTTASGVLDSFEGTLFRGAAPSAPAVASAPAAPPAPSTGSSPSSSQGAVGTTAQPAAPAQPAPQTGSTLQQLLYADLTLQQLGETADHPYIDAKRHSNVYFVMVHALESGGNTLTKGGFGGTRVFFSGGSVATFNVYNASTRRLLCAGAGFAYRGFVTENQMGLGIDDNPDPGSTSTPSPGSAQSSQKAVDELPAMHYFTKGSCG